MPEDTREGTARTAKGHRTTHTAQSRLSTLQGLPLSGNRCVGQGARMLPQAAQGAPVKEKPHCRHTSQGWGHLPDSKSKHGDKGIGKRGKRRMGKPRGRLTLRSKLRKPRQELPLKPRAESIQSSQLWCHDLPQHTGIIHRTRIKTPVQEAE